VVAIALDDDVTTIEPPRSSICGISYFIDRNTPRKSVLMTSSNSLAAYSCSGFSMVIPALLKATSSWP
jgi:hypothetical protein